MKRFHKIFALSIAAVGLAVILLAGILADGWIREKSSGRRPGGGDKREDSLQAGERRVSLHSLKPPLPRAQEKRFPSDAKQWRQVDVREENWRCWYQFQSPEEERRLHPPAELREREELKPMQSHAKDPPR